MHAHARARNHSTFAIVRKNPENLLWVRKQEQEILVPTAHAHNKQENSKNFK